MNAFVKKAKNIVKSATQKPIVGTTWSPKKVATSKYMIDTGGMAAKAVSIATRGVKAPIAPTIWFTPEAHEEMRHLVDICKKEVGWFFLVETLSDGDFLLSDICIPTQKVTAVETDIDANAMTEIALELLDKGKDPSTMFAWFHSHVNMGVTPSGQDEQQVEDYLDICPIFIRGITNKAGAMKVDVYYPEKGIAFTCVDTHIYYDALTPEREQELTALVGKKVSEVTYPTHRTYKHNTAPANNLANGANKSTGYNANYYDNRHVTKHSTDQDDAEAEEIADAINNIYGTLGADVYDPLDYDYTLEEAMAMPDYEFAYEFGQEKETWVKTLKLS